jgi:hypothetical protein
MSEVLSQPPGFFDRFMKNKFPNILEHRFGLDINNTSAMAKFKIQFMKTTTMFIFILVSSITIYYASTDKDVLTKKTMMYLFLILAPIAFGIYSTNTLFGAGDSGSIMKFLYVGVAFAVLGIGGYLYSKASPSQLIIFNYIAMVLIVFILIGGLALVYSVFSNYLKKQTGAAGYIINLIFYIPCLYADFIKYIKQELQITPSVVFIVFMIEILLIIMYLVLPKIASLVMKNLSKALLDKPIYLKEQKIIATGEHFLMDTPGKSFYKKGDLLNLGHMANPLDNKEDSHNIAITDEGNTYRNNNYAISFWVYVNYGNKSTTAYVNESNILNYAGGVDQNGNMKPYGKPSLTYVNDGKTHFNKFVAYFTNNPNASNNSYEFEGHLQKWNYIVFNYIGNRVDFFVNGNLETSFYFDEKNMPLPGSSTDNITVGNNNGLEGAICNVNYYKSPLPKYEIANTYNLLHYKNPPINLA